MPPKVNRRPAAKVKAAPKAAVRRQRLRRPAGAVEDPVRSFEAGAEVQVADASLLEF